MAKTYTIHHQPALPGNGLQPVVVDDFATALKRYRSCIDISTQGDCVFLIADRGGRFEAVLQIALVTKTSVIEIDPSHCIPAGIDLPL